tara:strand:- start:868 stop:1011 length:144 start_codon:yes stop_codon:yes gene_type:complete
MEDLVMTFNVYEIIEDKKTKVQEEEEEWVSEIIGSEDDELKRLLQEF